MFPRGFVFLLAAGCLVSGARGVIVSGGDGTGNTTGEGAGTGWDYVGAISGASGVYLGSYGGSEWVLTAGHVGAGNFTLNNVTYGAVANSAVTLTNSDGSFTDLVLFRIDGSPGLTTLALASQTPTSSVSMIGYGIGREVNETSGLGTSGSYTGYIWSGSQVKRWGGNRVRGSVTVAYANGVTIETFYTQFSQTAGRAQATTGDSGGGVFTSSGSLAGIMIAVGQFDDQPGNASVYSERTYAADISQYRSEILNIVNAAAPVPEPAAGLSVSLGLGLLFAARRFRKEPAAPRS